MLENLVQSAPMFLLVAVRCLTTMLFMPLLSSRNIHRRVKVALAFYMAYFIFPQISFSSGPFSKYTQYISPAGNFNLDYIFLLIGEGMIGAILGFFVQIIFAAFSTAGQFFAFQMGFSASEVYDALSQVENPLMGQFFNFVAMLIFLQNHWFQKIFLNGLVTSFSTLNAFSIIEHSDSMALFMMSSLTHLFRNALIIALPIMGTLFLINVTMGILSKAAPQMNLLSEGFPILILTAFLVIFLLLPYLCNFFEQSFNYSFENLGRLFIELKQEVSQ